MEFERKAFEYISEHNLLQPGDGIVVGVSGGADSVALFEMLSSLSKSENYHLAVVHVNHGIRGKDADEDENFVKALAEKNGCRCFVLHENVPEYAYEHKMTEEEAGRKLRYEFFEKVRVSESMNKIAVAHHVEDLAETVIFQMARGSLVSGLGGMSPEKGYVIRPLLSHTRREIEKYLSEKGVSFRKDKTNDSLEYARNRIRHEILPVLSEINNGAVMHIADMAENMRILDDDIKKRAAEFPLQIDNSNAVRIDLSIDYLEKELIIVQGEIILRVIELLSGRRKDITNAHIKAVLELTGKRSGSIINLPYGISARKNYHSLILEKINFCEERKTGRLRCIVQDADENLEILKKNYTKQIDCDKIKNALQLRNMEPEDYIVITKAGGQKKLRKAFTDLKIDICEREHVPVVADGNEIVWIVGYRLSERYKVSEKTKKIMILTYEQPGQ